MTRSQAMWLVSDKQVAVDGVIWTKLADKVPQGTWEITVRGRKHHVVVHPAFVE